MALSNCQKCGKLFNQTRGRICQACLDLEKEEFERVLEYIREHKVRFIVELAEETGVERAKILKWVDEGRLDLEVRPSDRPTGECNRCGRPTGGADLCDRCRKELASQIAQQRAIMHGTSQESSEAGDPSPAELRDGMHNRP